MIGRCPIIYAIDSPTILTFAAIEQNHSATINESGTGKEKNFIFLSLSRGGGCFCEN